MNRLTLGTWPFGAVREFRRLPALAFSSQFFTRTGLVWYARVVVSPRVRRNARRNEALRRVACGGVNVYFR